MPDLVGISSDGDEQVEVGPNGERGLVVPLFQAPQSRLERVQDHVVGGAVVARVHVERDVGVAPGSALQVHVESGGRSGKKTLQSKGRFSFVL